MSKARDLVVKFRTAERLIATGKFDEGVQLFKEACKEAKEANLFKAYIALIRKIRAMIERERQRRMKRQAQTQ